MKGTLYGIGVGPGDPELLTLKAMRLLLECDVLAVPAKEKAASVAYRIAREADSKIEKKECLLLDCPMTKEQDVLEKTRKHTVEKVSSELAKGKNVVFLTLGDPSIYSTFSYIRKEIQKDNYPVEIVSGVPSFCAIAAKLGISLSEEEEEIHIIPATYGIKESFNLPGTKILMKAGNQLKEIKKRAKEDNCYLAMVENCGMKEEKIIVGVENIPDTAGYFTTVIVRKIFCKNPHFMIQ